MQNTEDSNGSKPKSLRELKSEYRSMKKESKSILSREKKLISEVAHHRHHIISQQMQIFKSNIPVNNDYARTIITEHREFQHNAMAELEGIRQNRMSDHQTMMDLQAKIDLENQLRSANRNLSEKSQKHLEIRGHEATIDRCEKDVKFWSKQEQFCKNELFEIDSMIRNGPADQNHHKELMKYKAHYENELKIASNKIEAANDQIDKSADAICSTIDELSALKSESKIKNTLSKFFENVKQVFSAGTTEGVRPMAAIADKNKFYFDDVEPTAPSGPR